MENKPQSQLEPIKKIRELLVWSFIITGVLLVVISLFLRSPDAQTIVRSLGLSFAPSGAVALIISRYAASVTESVLQDTVRNTIEAHLKQDLEKIDATVQVGLNEINKVIEVGVSQIEANMKSMSPLFGAASKLGLENVHLTRGIALTDFAWFLDAEVQKAANTNKVWIVSSSLRGFLDATSEHFDGRRMMERIAHCKCDFKIMMTDPGTANSRAKQERRADGEIPAEVQMNLAYLKRIGIGRESVRFYPGTPTVFAVATTDRMLLNPYPYQAEAFRCFSVIVHKTLNPDADIYNQYLRHHFEEPWNRAAPIPAEYWDQL